MPLFSYRVHLHALTLLAAVMAACSADISESAVEAPTEDEGDDSSAVTVAGVSIAGGDWSSLASKNGRLRVIGDTRNGELGLGASNLATSWTTSALPTTVASIKGGRDYTLVLGADLNVYGAGSNVFGAMGIPSARTYTKTLSSAKAIAASLDSVHSLALKSDNTVWATGYNAFGEFGTGDTTNTTTWKQVLKVPTRAIAVGMQTSFAVIARAGKLPDNTRVAAGDLVVAGENHVGQLGTGDKQPVKTWKRVLSGVKAVAAGSNYAIALKTDGSLWFAGDSSHEGLYPGGTQSLTWIQAKTVTGEPMKGVTDIAVGSHQALAVRADGVWGFGFNTSYHELGANGGGAAGGWKRVLASSTMRGVAASAYLSLALDSSGKVWVTGNHYENGVGVNIPDWTLASEQP